MITKHADKAQATGVGVLYIVATPIGNLDDLSTRAVKTLATVDLIAAEDTRHSGRLLQYLGLHKPMMALHDHNERNQHSRILAELGAGRSVALISDAGTPLISDPGFILVREARVQGFQVSPIPGACALIAALSASGLPTDRFQFIGFLPAKGSGRRSVLESLQTETSTLVLYESPHRITDTIADVIAIMGAGRELVLGRELTKAFETFYNGTAEQVLAALQQDPHGSRGEFVVMIHGAAPEPDSEQTTLDTDRLLTILLTELPVKTVAKMVAEITGRKKNELYQRALHLKGGG